MSRDTLVSTFFNLTFQMIQANDELEDKTPNQIKYQMPEIQRAVISFMIEKSRKGVLDVSPQPVEKEGYTQTPPPSGNIPPPGSYNPPWPQFDAKIGQIPRPAGWDGTELCQAPKWLDKPWSSLPIVSVESYVKKNDDSKYHNKAQWELERRAFSNPEGTPPPIDIDDDDLPF